jgi:predicted nucleic acid-binding protein
MPATDPCAYVDTSILVAALTGEPGTAAAQGWLAAQGKRTLAVSDWCLAEFSAALSLKLRRRELNVSLRNESLAKFSALIEESLLVLPVEPLDFRAAAHLADQHATGLRAGDVLHLAVASRHGMTVHTLDKGMVRAVEIGIPTVLIA